MRLLPLTIFCSFAFCLSGVSLAAESQSKSDAVSVAQQVDVLLKELLAKEDVQPADLTNDEDFLRRIYLDLSGVVPSPKDITLFGLNGDAQKRTVVIDQLLASDDFGTLWGSYWREVIMSRATDQRATLVLSGLEAWLVEQFNNNRSWDDIARTLITATGSVRETGETGLIFAHTGEPEELAAEISRIFLGIQMSCANCHDHPTDSWKREEFHQLAAFLPRVSVRRETQGDPASWIVRSVDDDPRRRNSNFNVDQLFRGLDRNRDGQLAKSEARGPIQERFDRILEVADADKNKMLSKEEFEASRALAMTQQQGQGEMEYYMPDLNNPASRGTLTQPVFFIPEAKGPKLRDDADDMTRRHALTDYITSPTNPWFAKAFVNRIWSEMLGQGFYTPIDDMGPERIAMFEEVLDLLADGFVKNQYDVKWVYRTIANTDAYQRQIRTKNSEHYVPPFASASPTRLSSDQIYMSLFKVLGAEQGLATFARGNRGGMMGRRTGLDPGKFLFQQTFGLDLSMPKDEVIGNVPQGLFMMNSPIVETMIRGTGDTKLSRILKDQSDNEDALREVYLLVLSREPTDKEINIGKEYVTQVGSRTEAFEDLMWSLLNSTEFISKR
ncbi:DUF1549 domain-containing protein [Planctomicrobium sp.]|jgi:hypothetical protein|nr:DUF1549 domain-containing protein [Planctomicrobium sp.]MDB4743544.1 DUF1549 domain-containing protein [Planctomicrobium sp.]